MIAGLALTMQSVGRSGEKFCAPRDELVAAWSCPDQPDGRADEVADAVDVGAAGLGKSSQQRALPISACHPGISS
jgi:hypothetical protein